MNDVHDELVKAYLEYFKANDKFELRNSVRTHREVRRWLRTIRSLAYDRMEEIHVKHNTKKEANKKGTQ